MVHELSNMNRLPLIRERLKLAPKGLDDMLQHILERYSSQCDDEEGEMLNTILEWVTIAARPVCVGVLKALLTLRTPDLSDDEDNSGIIGLEDDLRLRYANFFDVEQVGRNVSAATVQVFQEVDRRDRLRYGTNPGNAVDPDAVSDEDAESRPGTESLNMAGVTFCHTSMGEFFRYRDAARTKALADDVHPKIGLHLLHAKLKIFRTCLQLLCGELVEPKYCSTVLADYTVNNWYKHLHDAVANMDFYEASDIQDIGRLLLRMLRDDKALFS